MGVPGLFSYLRKYNKKDDQFSTIKSELPGSGPVHLYLDFNGAVYQAIRPELTTEEALIIHTIDYLDKLVGLYMESCQKVYIALDGVPPRAKIEQQRARRFHSVCRKSRVSRIETATHSNLDKTAVNWHLDTNMITPGTIFMEKLRHGIINHIETTNMYRDIDVIFNDWSNPGEGEHKLLAHLREHRTADDVRTVIYGLDGDLIMLAMAARVPNIFLLREANEYGQYAFEHEGRPYLYMDIDCLKNALINECCHAMSTPFHMIQPDEIKRFIDDYIVLMMILGNDFMPKCHWISIKQQGHAILLSTYFSVQNGMLADEDKWLFDRLTGVYNLNFMQALFRILAEKEDELAHTYFEHRKKSRIHIPEQATERERQIQLMDFMPLQYLDIEADIRSGTPGWRERYYRICLQMKATPENTHAICEAYWRTLCWNAIYYMDECPCWEWFYPYDYSPTLADISTYLAGLKRSEARPKFSPSAPIQPQTLLLMVLPEQSSGLMARAIEQGIKNSAALMALYFPKSYELNMPCHTRYYECSPRIPRINLRMCLQFVKRCKLSPSEEARNVPGGVIRFKDGKSTISTL